MRVVLLLTVALAVLACTDKQHAEIAVVVAANRDRAAAGVPALQTDARLNAIAQHRAAEMALTGNFSHSPSDGCDAFCLMRSVGLPPVWAAENIGWNSWPTWAQAADVMEDGWDQSPPHFANIINCHMVLVGVGTAQSPDGRRWFAEVFWGDRSC